jgi:hypothetical protein
MVVDEMFPCIIPRKFRIDADFATTGQVYPMSREKEAGSAMIKRCTRERRGAVWIAYERKYMK